jgi:hypothetical protein
MLEDMTPEHGQYARLNADLNEDGLLEGYLADYDRHENSEIQKFNIFNITDYTPIRYKTPLKEDGTAGSYLDEDGNPDPEGSQALINAMTPQEFNTSFKPSWAKSLLRHHPEYCKLNTLESDPSMVDSYKRDAIIENTDTWAAAVSAGFLDENNGISIIDAERLCCSI